MNSKLPVVAIVGPTASGKTALSLALAGELNAEIIACDSRTVYRYFDIGTAKPSMEELAQIPHHLIDVAEPDENFTASDFAQHAAAIINDIHGRGKLAIICGGTGFYARALLEGLSIPDVKPDPALREQLSLFALEQGNEALHARLAALDPPTAARLGVNDLARITRALEVIDATGQPFSQAAGKKEPPYDTIWIGINAADRAFLHQTIRRRFVAQLEAGLLDETRRLYERFGPSQKLLRTVNYRQLVPFIEGQREEKAAIEEAIIANNQLARRQLIWFRANQAIKWFNMDELPQASLHRQAAGYIKDRLLSAR